MENDRENISPITNQVSPTDEVHPGNPPPYQPPENTQPEVIGSDEPPMYADVVKLPTYNESENINEEECQPDNHSVLLYFFRTEGGDDVEVGSDLGFVLCFLLSFVFNWIGFLASYCFTRSLSAQHGAISGFGLSIVKWAFIVRHAEWWKDYFDNSPIFMYLFAVTGWLIFLRGIASYVQMKRQVYSRLHEVGGHQPGLFC